MDNIYRKLSPYLTFIMIIFGLTMLATALLGEHSYLCPNEPLERIRLIGEYSVDGLTPAELTAGTKFDASEKHRVTLTGHFDKDIEKNVTLMLRIHNISVSMRVNGEEVFTYGKKGTYPSVAHSAGNVWQSFVSPGITKDDDIEIILNNFYREVNHDTFELFVDQMRIGSERADEALLDLSDYLHANLSELGNENMISFKQEMNNVNCYLSIEKIRLADRLKVDYNIGYADFKLPALSLEAIVESALRKGIERKPGGGTIKVKTERKQDIVVITVSDDGAGFNLDEVEAGDDGIANVKLRLDYLCAGTLKLVSEPWVGTTVTIKLPIEKTKEVKSDAHHKNEPITQSE